MGIEESIYVGDLPSSWVSSSVVWRHVTVVLCPNPCVRMRITMYQVCVPNLELPGLGLSEYCP